jgi:hypothetical protein
MLTIEEQMTERLQPIPDQPPHNLQVMTPEDSRLFEAQAFEFEEIDTERMRNLINSSCVDSIQITTLLENNRYGVIVTDEEHYRSWYWIAASNLWPVWDVYEPYTEAPYSEMPFYTDGGYSEPTYKWAREGF